MTFVERVVARVFTHVFDKAWSLVQAKIQESIDREAIIRHHDKVSAEMKEKLRVAQKPEEIDALLHEMYNYGVDT